jgi:hypothetical protein
LLSAHLISVLDFSTGVQNVLLIREVFAESPSTLFLQSGIR